MGSVVEHLKSVTGGDAQHINRKNRKYWEGELTARIIVFANELLRLQDASGALAGRFLTFQMRQSFRGREDPNLTEKLLAERSGILNLALDALERVKARDGLIQCRSGAEMSDTLTELGSDVLRFVTERCIVGAEHEQLLGRLFEAWTGWCSAHGIRYAWDDEEFSKKLDAAVPNLTRTRSRKDNPKRRTKILGIRLRTKDDE
jgi:putative DNA primase/helicase